MDQYGLRNRRLQLPHLEFFLGAPHSRPRVWILRTYLNGYGSRVIKDPPQPILRNYGFHNYKNDAEVKKLKVVYTKILAKADPLEVDKVF
ncbi:hypothetical protein K469DRAFT_715451 [Zopfia rhizophila CBS 207.26]|uniref:Uncharacterized protein n=1 Tax=Zopfia rhizophila CBS 207.26 TaxID=1314779 RepID=A0A6A6DRE8_9PEZI|nr:hypothetical protein K469DRAFT_715451 [Zopfia rhizophila CBS 207.26]